MIRKQKKNLIVKIIHLVGNAIIGVAIAIFILAMFAGAYLQESYKLNPPTEAERAEHPILVKFLAGE